MRTVVRTAALPAAAALLLTGCASPGDPEVAIIEITSSGFTPAALTVAPGTEVRWANVQPQAHTVRSGGDLGPEQQQAIPDGAAEFDSGRLQEGETFAHVFEVEGEYFYECEYHGDEQMVGTIRVVEP